MSRGLLGAMCDESTDDRAGHDELNLGREGTRPVPTEPSVKELASANSQRRNDVLQVWDGARRRTERRRVERTPSGHEQRKTKETARDLEPARVDVPVRQKIAGKVKERTQGERVEPRTADGSSCRAGRNMKRNDHPPADDFSARAPTMSGKE